MAEWHATDDQIEMKALHGQLEQAQDALVQQYAARFVQYEKRLEADAVRIADMAEEIKAVNAQLLSHQREQIHLLHTRISELEQRLEANTTPPPVLPTHQEGPKNLPGYTGRCHEFQIRDRSDYAGTTAIQPQPIT
ncbi:hypothetical protein JTE90_010248 [Oedothorax gibbosus]|uniref:Uncharacterized protein n=1 Tax=Oedothorax gibbosus TaxID=931172 RepID=A0AAV6TMB2_9ARAC|nr:hypothetical protein JTE90_027174 [Oedothorax gibbosus]KAG8172853.1 hypothetical protein JTE90_010246 [Oedothorax gibbosus]KAG8172855.1 hypothetical protein JTE90_010248 [Oedothorax gibbosus]